MKRLSLCFLLSLLWTSSSQALTGEEILERIDKNYEVKTRISTATMIVKGRRGTRTITSKTWAEGYDKTFTHYLSPPREKDTKMLKLGDELWIWSPSADRTIEIAGHMLRQSLMGSDVSYEDFMEDPKLSNSYTVKRSGDEEIDGRDCYILDLEAMEGKELSYYRRKLWVDKERFLPLREELYARSGKLLKTFTIKEIFRLSDRWYPKRMVFKDVLVKGEGTEIILESVEFNVPIGEHVFSKASLRR